MGFLDESPGAPELRAVTLSGGCKVGCVPERLRDGPAMTAVEMYAAAMDAVLETWHRLAAGGSEGFLAVRSCTSIGWESGSVHWFASSAFFSWIGFVWVNGERTLNGSA